MKSKWTALSLLFLIFASAAASARTMKVVAQDGVTMLNGSSYVFIWRGKVYAATSEHVVPAHPFDGRLVLRDSSFEVEAVIVRRDWGRDLAILEVKNATERFRHQLTDIGDQAAFETVNGDELTIEGFPSASETSVRTTAVVLLNSSARILPQVRGIEVHRTHGEFGMSGGPVWDSRHSVPVGLLSHQVIEAQAGGASVAARWVPGKLASHLFVVPFAAVYQLLSESNENAIVRLAPLSSRTRISVGGIDLVETPASKGERLQRGGDGVGIGGEDHADAVTATIRLSDLQGGSAVSRSLASRLDSWKGSLQAGGQLRLTGFVRIENRDLSTLTRLSARSLSQLVAGLMDESLYPIVQIENESRRDARLESYGRLLTEANSSQQSLAKLDGKNSFLQTLASLIAILPDQPEKNEAFAIYLGQALDWQGQFKNDWIEIYRLNFDEGVNLLRSLSALRCEVDLTCRNSL